MWSLISTGVPGVQRLLEAAAAVGEHDGPAAGPRRRTHAVHDRRDALALVVVGAAEEDQRLQVAGADRADLAGVAGDGGRAEAGQVGGAISAVVSPSMSAAGSQPEPSTSATSWRSTPVSSASLVGGAGGELVGCPGRLRVTRTTLGATLARAGWGMIDHFGINCSDLAASAASTTRPSAPSATPGSWTSASRSATARQAGLLDQRPARGEGPASGPNREIHVAFAAEDRRRRTRLLRRRHVPRRRGAARAPVLAGVPRPLLRRLRPRPRRQQRRGCVSHGGAGVVVGRFPRPAGEAASSTGSTSPGLSSESSWSSTTR